MNNAAQLQVFNAQTQNVRLLKQAREQVKRAINYAIRKNDRTSVQVHTKVFALIFCAWVEANFSKVIHTPYGFNPDEMAQIKANQRKSLGEGWKKCIELGLKRISNPGRSNYIPNIRQKLFSIVDEYVIAPSQVRNKVAHGQWIVALNQEHTAVNIDITKNLSDLDIVVITIWYEVQMHLSNIVETLVESPNRAFHRDYWKEIAALDAFLEKSKDWSISQKTLKLRKKPIRVNNTI